MHSKFKPEPEAPLSAKIATFLAVAGGIAVMGGLYGALTTLTGIILGVIVGGAVVALIWGKRVGDAGYDGSGSFFGFDFGGSDGDSSGDGGDGGGGD